jgi:hypothetical protein
VKLLNSIVQRLADQMPICSWFPFFLLLFVFFFWISNVVFQKTQKGATNTMGIGRQAQKQPPKIQTLETETQPGRQPNQTQKISPRKNTQQPPQPPTAPQGGKNKHF